MSEQRTKDPVLVHKVCKWICQEIEASGDALCSCKECPMVDDTPYGTGFRYCVLRAQELIALVKETP